MPPFVFVVEDNVLLQMALQTDLADAGFSTVAEGRYDHAMARIATEANRFDALITDVNLGEGQSGWEVARSAREVKPNLPIVYVTGDSAHEWRTHGVSGSLLFQKPFSSADIIEALKNLVADSDASIARSSSD